ncbi:MULTISPECIES: TetR/AcrR family transcriptional regulator [unclassified Actinotalea]|uniref:TetR/AcrR family transcriptional regulator n=1 Tax=unclassified Actinotalea TaxID=2638618 RepID=UPI0015F46512|nr:MULTISPECIES: TetR family transcriptional regulator [unclassified Actinotalea]
MSPDDDAADRPPKARAPQRRRALHTDPDRRAELIRTTLDVIAERGVAGATHRAVGAAAGVSPGSLTYHYSTLDELHQEAFGVLADDVASALEARMRSAPDAEAAVEALAQHLADDLVADRRSLLLAVELYVAAARRPALREVTEAWMVRSRRALELHFDPVTARELDALVEGLVLHQALSTDPMTPEQLRHALLRLTR